MLRPSFQRKIPPLPIAPLLGSVQPRTNIRPPPHNGAACHARPVISLAFSAVRRPPPLSPTRKNPAGGFWPVSTRPPPGTRGQRRLCAVDLPPRRDCIYHDLLVPVVGNCRDD